MHRALPILLFLGSCGQPTDALEPFGWDTGELPSGVVVIDRVEQRYELMGATSEQLTEDLQRHRPAGERYTGWTRWRTRWTFETLATPEGCAVGPVDVELHVTQVLPVWHAPDHADQDLVDRWNDYLDALREHEDHHAELAERAAWRIQRALESLAPQVTCTQMRHEANRAGHLEVEGLRKANHRYDDVTGHGAEQGAVFPAPATLALVDSES